MVLGGEQISSTRCQRCDDGGGRSERIQDQRENNARVSLYFSLHFHRNRARKCKEWEEEKTGNRKYKTNNNERRRQSNGIQSAKSFGFPVCHLILVVLFSARTHTLPLIANKRHFKCTEWIEYGQNITVANGVHLHADTSSRKFIACIVTIIFYFSFYLVLLSSCLFGLGMVREIVPLNFVEWTIQPRQYSHGKNGNLYTRN